MAEYLETWLPSADIRATTRENYETLIKAYITPGIGHYRLQQLRARHLTDFYKALRDNGGRLGRGLGPKSISNVHALIRSFLRDALEDDLLTVDRTPADTARLPRFPVADDDPLPEEAPSIEVVQRLADLAARDRLYALWILAAATGLRRGEVLGLQWSDIDEDAILTVRREIVLHRNAPSETPPKSKGSRRQIPLPPDLVDALAAHRARQDAERRLAGSAWIEGGFIFTREDGSVLHPAAVYRRTRRLFQEAGGKGHVRALRHFFMTSGRSEGVDTKVLSLLLGHTRVTTSQDHYERPTTDTKRTATGIVLGLVVPPKAAAG